MKHLSKGLFIVVMVFLSMSNNFAFAQNWDFSYGLENWEARNSEISYSSDGDVF